jgi:hypothetical protein
MIDEKLVFPGEINIKDIILVSFDRSTFVSLQDYLIELNITESLFSSVVSGTIMLSDSRNLIQELKIDGSEYLYIDVRTPTLEEKYGISKLYKIYGLDDKQYVNDGATLIYKLNFSSTEQFNDLANPIYRAFEGKPEEVVQQIFFEYLQADRGLSVGKDTPKDNKSPITIMNDSDNVIKFVSPGWNPLQCINWIASKTLPKNGKAANYLFWETTKGFYFGSMDSILNYQDNTSIGEYVYSQSFIDSLKADERHLAMYAIRSLRIDKSFDNIMNNMTGYLSSRLINVDLYNKNYENVDYDHAEKFSKYSHTESDNPVPLFNKDIVRNPLSYVQVNYSHPKLYNDLDNNFDTKVKDIFGNRRSNMVELQNFNMEIVIPGRTDVECGNLIDIILPKKDPGALSSENKTTFTPDPLYSGSYLIASLTHKINLKTHYVAMSLVKDSFSSKEKL